MVIAMIAAFCIAYLLGNLNGAIVISRLIANEDVRTKGSGNAGLTNFTRNYGSAGSVFVILIDVLKAILACLLGGLMFPEDPTAGRTLGGVAVMLGHGQLDKNDTEAVAAVYKNVADAVESINLSIVTKAAK